MKRTILTAAAAAILGFGGVYVATSSGSPNQQTAVSPIVAAASATSQSTSPIEDALIAMADEEKLAQELYAALGERYGTPFSRITASETTHLAAIRAALNRLGIADPTTQLPTGKFAVAEHQAIYDQLLASGKQSKSAALAAGVAVEKQDISDIANVLALELDPETARVLGNLSAASARHLQAFSK